MRKTVLFSIIRNGINNGYPFIESYGSWLNFCDQIVIYDGQSDDGTDYVLKSFAKLNSKVSIQSAPWPKAAAGGSSIALFTDQAFKEVRQTAENLVYIQADELVTRATRSKFAKYEGSSVIQLTRYVLFWNSFFRVLGEEMPGQFAKASARIQSPVLNRRSVEWKSYRLFPPGVIAKSLGDGLTFDIGSSSAEDWDDEVLHYGWCFPVNILQKHVSHARIYADNLEYRARGRDAQRLLQSRTYSVRDLDLLDPKYLNCAIPFSGDHVPAANHLLGQRSYDPYVGLQLLKGNPEW